MIGFFYFDFRRANDGKIYITEKVLWRHSKHSRVRELWSVLEADP